MENHTTVSTDIEQVEELLTRSVAEILPSREQLKEVLLSGKKLRLYIGTDATGTSLHLGHATNYLILEKFRKLGHEVIFLIGDFTSRIGDPTDKDAARVPLTREQVIENTKTWINQVSKVIDVENADNPVKILYNHDWLSKMNFEDIIDLSSNFTVQQMLERDMFEKRMTENKPIHVHEFFYPLMQGWDSVVMDVDVELCGNDQKFNALVGRTLQKRYNNKEKFVFITTLLVNPKTNEKMMSKSLGTGIFLDFSPTDMYGGIMAQPDENLYQLFVDTTRISMQEISEIKNKLEAGSNPMEFKKLLARTVVEMYHSKELAEKAEQDWIETFSNKGLPTDIPEFSFVENMSLCDLLIQEGLVKSKSEFRRLIEEGAIKAITNEGEEKIIDTNSMIGLRAYKIGSKRFIRVV